MLSTCISKVLYPCDYKYTHTYKYKYIHIESHLLHDISLYYTKCLSNLVCRCLYQIWLHFTAAYTQHMYIYVNIYTLYYTKCLSNLLCRRPLSSDHLKRTVSSSGSPGQTGSPQRPHSSGFSGSKFSSDICFECLRIPGWVSPLACSGPNCAITFSAGVSCTCRRSPLKGWVLNH